MPKRIRDKSDRELDEGIKYAYEGRHGRSFKLHAQEKARRNARYRPRTRLDGKDRLKQMLVIFESIAKEVSEKSGVKITPDIVLAIYEDLKQWGFGN